MLDHCRNLDKIVGQFTNADILFSRLFDLFQQNGIAYNEVAGDHGGMMESIIKN